LDTDNPASLARHTADCVVEAIPEQQKEVVGGKYFIQFSFTALSTATAIPIIEAIGIGHASTIGMCT
jgi:hypothetical protein